MMDIMILFTLDMIHLDLGYLLIYIFQIVKELFTQGYQTNFITYPDTIRRIYRWNW